VPGNIGVREATVGVALTYLGSDFNFGVFATTLDRIIAMFWVGILGSFCFSYFIVNPFKNLKAPNRESNSSDVFLARKEQENR